MKNGDQTNLRGKDENEYTPESRLAAKNRVKVPGRSWAWPDLEVKMKADLSGAEAKLGMA
jgi:hypothetical protein